MGIGACRFNKQSNRRLDDDLHGHVPARRLVPFVEQYALLHIIFGDNVEERMGGVRYLIFYLLSGVAAVLLQTYILPGSNVPMIGASGAIAGVLGAYLISFPRSRIASLVPILFIFTIVEIPAAIFLVIWFIIQVYSGLFAMQGAAASGIAWWAHIGGFVFGVSMVSFFARRTAYRTWQQE